MDFSFINLYKNDFVSALNADNTPIQTLRYGTFIQQKTNEYFLQTSAGGTSINFVGAIQVDLIDSCQNVKQNIDNNFFYVGFADSSGVSQISFAFGYIGVDYYKEQLHLKITDLVNGNVWYSNGFYITDYNAEISTRFDYFNNTKLHNISYDLAPYIQSIRISECYDQSPANKRNLKQYENADGKQVNYRTITTFLRKYVIESVDNFINDRLEVLFAHSKVYLNGQRVVVSDYKAEDRKGDSNWMNGEFLVNKQDEKLNLGYQIYEYLQSINLQPLNNGVYTIDSLPSLIITFNKNIFLRPDFNISIYKDGVIQSIAPITTNISGNQLELIPSYTFTNGEYDIIIEPNLVYNGVENWEGLSLDNWHFTISEGEFDNTEFNNEFLIN